MASTSALDLEEFRYYYGDSRPFLHNYLVSTGKVESYLNLDKDETKFPLSKMTQFKCSKEDRRQLVLPPVRTMAKLENIIKNGTAPFVILPIIIVKKYGCKSYDYLKHAVLLLYNRVSHEIERIDIKRHHLDGYAAKLILKRLPKIVQWMQTFDPEVKLVEEIDTLKLFTKHPNFKDYYPMFIITYLHKRLASPSTPRKTLLTRLYQFPLDKFKKDWKKYVDYRSSIKDKCRDISKQYHPELNKCVNVNSHSLNSILIEDIIKECKENLIYDTLRRKCVSPKNLAVIDILQPENISIKKKERYIHFGKNETSLMIIAYIISKYSYARTFLPQHGYEHDNDQNNAWKIKWRWDVETEQYVFEKPDNFWETWNEFMNDDSVRFIILYVSLTSKPHKKQGHHANMMIYDKNVHELERFDGLGTNISSLYGIHKFDNTLKEMFQEEMGKQYSDFKYLVPLDYCPTMPVFQSKEINDIPGDDIRGNCAVWAFWYLNVRLANPHLNRKQVIIYATKKLEKVESLYTFIKMYQKYITQNVFDNNYVKKYLKKERDIEKYLKNELNNQLNNDNNNT